MPKVFSSTICEFTTLDTQWTGQEDSEFGEKETLDPKKTPTICKSSVELMRSDTILQRTSQEHIISALPPKRCLFQHKKYTPLSWGVYFCTRNTHPGPTPFPPVRCFSPLRMPGVSTMEMPFRTCIVFSIKDWTLYKILPENWCQNTETWGEKFVIKNDKGRQDSVVPPV